MKNDTASLELRGVAPLRYVVIDELICSGTTINHITRIIKEEYPRAKSIGIYCYLPQECAYSPDENGAKLFIKDFDIELLNKSPTA